MSDEFKVNNSEIKEYFGERLISITIFGSSCRGNQIDLISDIDYIVVLEDLVGALPYWLLIFMDGILSKI